MDTDVIAWIGGAIATIAAFIASRPILVRVAVRFAIKRGLKSLWKYINNYRLKYAQGTQQYDDITEIAEAIEVLCRLAGERLDINIRPKQLEPTYRTRGEKKMEKLERKLDKKPSWRTGR